jgi:hypothetical protein
MPPISNATAFRPIVIGDLSAVVAPSATLYTATLYMGVARLAMTTVRTALAHHRPGDGHEQVRRFQPDRDIAPAYRAT